jgi:hypothetical protein
MVRASSKKSQFGLSYNDIMDVWKEMNKGNEEGGESGGGDGKPSADAKKSDK